MFAVGVDVSNGRSIYYGKVRDCLKEKGLWEQPTMEEGSRG